MTEPLVEQSKNNLSGVRIVVHESVQPGVMFAVGRCSDCNGTGKRGAQTCSWCHGAGLFAVKGTGLS